ncbi:hypothetical protein GCM10009539_76880 [Cryptosporangium japonicum]|uniref:Uncharacterized protein n=1 Tax=Cryptosporangium japonicum TaxID=80872 RepID=A0ABP3EWQ2_9ACTN
MGVTSAGGPDRVDGSRTGRGDGRDAAAGVPPITSTVLAPEGVVVIRNSSEAPGS